MSGYSLHPEAYADIDQICDYIAFDSLDAPDRVRKELFATFDLLVPFPNRGHRRPDLSSRPLRFIVVRDYLIAYAPEERAIWVIAVMHGRLDPRVMAAILRGREDFLPRT
ncbi:MAG: type II toxin-antitoxin system RelE/ParE family toxin [Bryobacterales bacterium]|nr:type II toxin-antitoxin system RelE/ParE family toxin [Bryobacterales bacterium]